MNELEKYVTRHLASELSDIQNSYRKNEYPELSDYEKAIIYKYSGDGFFIPNQKLRLSNGTDFDEFAKHLDYVLSKLPNYEDLVYRKVYLTDEEKKRYQDAITNNTKITEYAFTSTSKSRLIAMLFDRTAIKKPNTLFRIQCKTGKEIDKIAIFGEQEVLIRPNILFEILDIRKESDYVLITMMKYE